MAQSVNNPIYPISHSASACEAGLNPATAAGFSHFIFPLSSVILELRWIRRSLSLLLIVTVSAVIHAKGYASSALIFARLLQMRANKSAELAYTATLIQSFITVRLDHCSSLYAGLRVGRSGRLDGYWTLSRASLDASTNMDMSPASHKYVGCAPLAPA